MEIIRKKYKYTCERCKTNVLDLNFEDFKKDVTYKFVKDKSLIPFSYNEYIHTCPVCGKFNNLNDCEIYESKIISDGDRILSKMFNLLIFDDKEEVSDED